MKILVVCQFYYPENFVITNIAESLVKEGHSVDVLTGKPNYGYGYILPEYKNIKEEIINTLENATLADIQSTQKNLLAISRKKANMDDTGLEPVTSAL